MANSYFSDSSYSRSGGDDIGKIFVGGLSWETTVDDLREHFERFGSIADCIVSMDRNTGRSKGFGFVTFDDDSVVDRVLHEEHLLQGRNIEPQRAKPRGSGGGGGGGGFSRGGGSKKLFLGGLDESLSESDLRDHFSAFGNVVSVHLPTDRDTGERKPFGFVEFDTEGEADSAVAAGAHTIAGRDVDVQKARSEQNRGDRGGYRGGYGGRGGGGGGGYGRRGGRGYSNNGFY